MPFSWTGNSDLPIIVAHRGCSADAPENTLAAFAAAIACGADAIELDVRCSADGKVVVIHDATLNRTTDGRGRVAKLPYTAIRQHSAQEQFGDSFSNEGVPLLNEVFDLVANRIGVNIEIKEPPRSKRYDIIEECLRLIRRHRAQRIVMISSFHHSYVRRAKQLEPAITGGVLLHALRHVHRNPVRLATSVGASFLLCNTSALQKRLVNNAHEHGVRAGVYTVNSTRSVPRLVRAGVDLIFTDDPVKIRTAVREYQS